MCGLAAIFAYAPQARPVDAGELLGMRERMRERGPDGAGLWCADDRRVGLAHRRLSIIDLSEQGAQPMASADGRYRIVFNGEIYNHRALRAELDAQGVEFRSQSDTEVLLALYAQCGPGMLERLRGMFAFAIWDRLQESLFLARDPYGIKPLYYADDGRTLRVASQVQALRAGGAIDAALDAAGVAGFFLFGSLPEPFTIYRAVRSLPAGCWLRAGGGRVEGPRRWHSLAQVWRDAAAAAAVLPSGNGLRDMGEALRDSVRHHLVADVPVGAFLSAGIDSGALVGLMAEAGAAPETLTVAFEEFRGLPQDDAPLAAELAAYFGVAHRVDRVGEARFRDDLPRILAAMDQPSIDGVNTWYAAQAARQAGLKVVISGLGGDELFAGYPAFREVPRWTRWFRLPGRIPGLGRTVRRLLSPWVGHRLHPKAAGLLEYGGSWPGAWLLRRGLFMPWELPALMGVEAAREGLERLAPLERIGAVLVPDPGTAFGRVAAMEAGLYMRNQLLRDADWAGMAHGVEIRVPLVDVELLRWVAPVMLRPGQTADAGKQALALAPRRALPEAIRQRRKTGFTVPFADWIGRIDGLDSWKREPALAQPGCHWSRRLAYALGQDLLRGL
ncbi:MAG: asparagine synthase (glutamine-hydrolyzing) [Chromatiaceae bacterium]|nr:MAG: asparagine synthase (glutamine-hydrolyzing) [Chromatiaceae bacterium]